MSIYVLWGRPRHEREDAMKITDITVERYAWPRPKPISNGKYTYVDVSLNLVHIYTDEGVTGVGWGGGTASGQGSDLTTTLIDYFKPVVVGRIRSTTGAFGRICGCPNWWEDAGCRHG